MINPLNSISPLLIFTLKAVNPFAGKANLTGVSAVANDIIGLAGGLPIPIYLDESTTGLAVDSEDRTLAIETITQQPQNGEKATLNQKGVTADLSINISAKKTSLFTQVILALAEQAYDLAVAKGCSVSYFHGAETVINGVLASFVTSQDADTELMKIQIRINKGPDTAKVGYTQTNPGAVTDPIKQASATP